MGSTVPPEVAALMGEACGTVEAILEVLDGRAERAGHLITPYVMAGGAAADARDALVTAPGTPPPGPAQGRPLILPSPGASAADAAAALAEVAGGLAVRLADAATSAPDRRDQQALSTAAQAAFAVQGYLTGTGQWPPGR